jgi:hypothetical protein
MRFKQTLAAILLCAAVLTLSHPVDAATRPSQKPRAKAQAVVAETQITEEKIKAVILGYVQAVKDKNLAAIGSSLAPDVRIKLKWGDKPAGYLSRAQYLANLKVNFQAMLDYQHMLKSVSATIAPDGQSATAEAEEFETMILTNGSVAGMSSTTLTFKILKGKIVIASIDSTTIPV